MSPANVTLRPAEEGALGYVEDLLERNGLPVGGRRGGGPRR
jgi:hypothetical protein